jgi:antitoxin component YwqK of YwqJK toxin-antitoxin module
MIDANGKFQGHWIITWEMVYGKTMPGPMNAAGIALEGNYIDSRREELWTSYHPNQVKASEILYSADKRNGSASYFTTAGNLNLRMHFSNDIPDSVMTFYYPSGIVLASYTWNNGRLDGPAKTYWDDGRLCEEGIWKHGYWESKPRYHHRLR